MDVSDSSSSMSSYLTLLVLGVLSGLAVVVWRFCRGPSIHRGKVTSKVSVATRDRPLSPTGKRKPSPHGKVMARPASHLRASNTGTWPNGTLNHQTAHVNYIPRHQLSPRTTTRLHCAPIRSTDTASNESSPIHSPYVPHYNVHHHAEQQTQPHIGVGRQPTPKSPNQGGWRSMPPARISSTRGDYGQFQPLAPGSIKTDSFDHHPTETNGPTSLPIPETIVKPVDKSVYKPPVKLQPLRVGMALIEQFALIAEENTNRNIETVGLLAGKLITRADGLEEYLTSHVIIPEQHGTHDTCELLHEEVMPGLLADQELLQFGWIHTHPKYAAFLSSVDLHTHFSYQMFLPEAIAIVWAPDYDPTYGIFSLTDEGMHEIETCQERGFHKHVESNLFKNSSHVTVDPSLDVTIIDLRVEEPQDLSSEEILNDQR